MALFKSAFDYNKVYAQICSLCGTNKFPITIVNQCIKEGDNYRYDIEYNRVDVSATNCDFYITDSSAYNNDRVGYIEHKPTIISCTAIGTRKFLKRLKEYLSMKDRFRQDWTGL